MELDVLKQQLKIYLENSSAFKEPALPQSIIFQKANDAIATLKKSLFIETLFAVVASVVFVCLAFLFHTFSFRIYFGIFSSVSVAFVIALLIFNARLKKLHHSQTILKHLRYKHSMIELYIKNYLRFCIVLLPVCFCLAVFVFLFEFYIQSPHQQLFTTYMLKHLWLPLLISYCFFSVLMYFFTKFYLKKMYGNHLSFIENLIQELENE